jgi:hypothetical protein
VTGPVLTAVALALVASVALNGSFLVQHLGARGAPRVTLRRPAASLRGLLASRLWLAGTAVGLAGWMLHVAALSRAPLSLIQAFSAGGLALAVPLAARMSRAPLAASERRAVLVMVGALVVLALGVAPSGPGTAAAAAMAAFAAVAAAIAAAFATAPAGGRRAHGLGIAAGVLYGRVRVRKWLERLGEGLVWDGGLFLAAPVQHERVVVVDRAGELGQQPCLAHPGLARDERHAPLAAARARERLVQAGDRRLAAREGATANDLQALRERHDTQIGVAGRALPPQLRRQLAGRRRGRHPKLPHQPP